MTPQDDTYSIMEKFILWLSEISKDDIALVGGKNASLGEMYCNLTAQGVRVPNGFALTAGAYWHFIKSNNLDKTLAEIFSKFNKRSLASLQKTGKLCRAVILKAKIPQDLQEEIIKNYQMFCQRSGQANLSAAVRSSATAEDLKGASFAGAMETFLNVRGNAQLLLAVKKCLASLFTDRSIAYREEKGFEHLKIALSVGVLQMVRSDLASSGVMFTLDTESGFRDVVVINSIYGIGELIVKGRITPDEFIIHKPTLEQGFASIIVKNLGRKNVKYVFKESGGLKESAVAKTEQRKFSLTDEDALTLARWAIKIEKHYGFAQDIEWAKDGKTGELFIVQARPETVQTEKNLAVFQEYELKKAPQPILTGIAIGSKIGSGQARIITSVKGLARFCRGEVLITKMTDPDWVPAIRLAGAVITDEGGRTCHSAIVSRELGIPCIVGAGKASRVIKTGDEITVDCSAGAVGKVYKGKVDYEIKEYRLSDTPKLPVKIMLNIAAPQTAFANSFLPTEGVGLAREEFIIAEKIKIHPLALIHYVILSQQAKNLTAPAVILRVLPKDLNGRDPSSACWRTQGDTACRILRPNGLRMTKSKLQSIIKKIDKLTIEYKDKKEFFVKELAEGVGQIAAAFWPKPVIVRFSDFKTNEYRALIGGELFEPQEENPMLGWRGASRYYDENFKPAFLLECAAIKRARDVFGLKNIKVMVPFCRTIEEAKQVMAIIGEAGLKKGWEGLEVYMMAEIPSNVILSEQFLEIFDGMSIGSNDLTQLVLGIDRDNGGLGYIGDERNEAVKEMISRVIKICREKNKYCGICGQAPSDFPEFAQWLIEQSIESISLNPDSVLKTLLKLGEK